MRRITALHTGRGQAKRVNVFLDGKFAFKLESELVAREGLAVEQMLPVERIQAIVTSNNTKRCYNAAVQFLSYRPRSEPEIRQRLQKRGFNTDSIEAAIGRLKKQGLVDDRSFAQFWKENRESFSPRSQWLIRLELGRKGVADDIIDQVVATIDDEDSANRAALKKVHQLSGSEYRDFRRRLGEYLKRRGFSYGVIESTVTRIWQEQENNSTEQITQL